MELFCDLQRQRDGIDFDRLDSSEVEESIGLQGLYGQRVVGSKTDIEQECLKRSPSEGSRGPKAMASAKAILRYAGSLDREDEEVASVVSGGVEQCVE